MVLLLNFIGRKYPMNNIDFSKASIDELNGIGQGELQNLSEGEYAKYYRRSVELENKYMFNGIPEQDSESIWYGTSIKRITKFSDRKWVIAQGFGILAKFVLPPLMLNGETFSEKMKELGVSDELLKDFFSMKEEIIEQL